jgi:hypothetical protein
MRFYCSSYVLRQFHNIVKKRPAILEVCILNVEVAFCVQFLLVPQNIVRIGPIVKKWQPIFEVQNGGVRSVSVRKGTRRLSY